jgi:Tfp pilus assembly protein PilV
VDYIILILALAVTGFAGVQFCYMMFLQAANRQQQRRIAELERELVALRHAQSGAAADVPTEVEEVWSELIDEGGA